MRFFRIGPSLEVSQLIGPGLGPYRVCSPSFVIGPHTMCEENFVLARAGSDAVFRDYSVVAARGLRNRAALPQNQHRKTTSTIRLRDSRISPRNSDGGLEPLADGEFNTFCR